MGDTNKTKKRYYKAYSDEFVTSKNQNYQLPENYIWIHENKFYNIGELITYSLAWIFGFFYCKWGLNIKFENREILNDYKKTGFFLYGNHTQPVGDVFIPSQICKRKRIFTVVSPANLGVPIIGRLLPMMGALPIPTSIHKMKELWGTIRKRIEEKHCVVIYPEEHVWPYYTDIRPFPITSFRFPIECNVPAFCMTTTYQKRRFSKKPQITVYVDGPFLKDNSLNKKQQQKKLCDEIHECMVQRSKSSTYEYIKYEKQN